RVFKLSKDGSGYRVLHRFGSTPSDVKYPRELVKASDGAFYGTTAAGGASGFGTVFKLWPLEMPDMIGAVAVGSSVQLSFAGLSGYRYQIFRSTDLTNWTALPPITMPPAGIYTNFDNLPLSGQAFYRAAWVQ